MKTIPILLTALLTLPIAGALVPTIKEPDGLTALIAAPSSPDGEVLVREANGDLLFDVTLFRKVDGAWSQVRMGAALRLVVYDELSVEPEGRDVYSKGFLSSASAPIQMRVPGYLVPDPAVVDVWVTMSPNDGTFPTSHYSVQKNALIAAGQLDGADVFDYRHGLNPVVLR